MNKIAIAVLIMTGLLLSHQSTHAGSATWSVNPPSNDWDTSANWSPATVPNSATDVATFGNSSTTNIGISHNTECDSMIFNTGASAFTFAPIPGKVLTISGAGVINNSGVMQNFVTAVD